MTLFKAKYRVDSARLQGWDYTSAAWYFVTLCTKDKKCFFGEIVNEQMTISPIGAIVAEEWNKTPEVRSGTDLDEWILMPNHLHGIIVIGSRAKETPHRETPHRCVSTSTSRLQKNSLGAMIGQFKSVCTKRIWAAAFKNFAWQPRYYDHVIRDEKSLRAIREYIVNNPAKWQLDKDNPIGLRM